MKKISTLILMILTLTGCSTAYHKKSFLSGGYNDMRLSKDSYLVEYNSNAYTDNTTNTKHALRRAAELTKQNGYQYFKIVNTSDTTSKYTTPVVVDTTTNENVTNHARHSIYGSSTNIGNKLANSSTIIYGGNTMTRPGVAIVITMLNNEATDSYDADIILSNFPSK